MKTKKVSALVTGYEAFLGESMNPSERLVRDLAESGFDTLILPVEYEGAFSRLELALVDNDYDLLIMLGQAGGRATVSLERVALNLKDSSHADASGLLCLEQKIREGADTALMTDLPLRAICEELKEKGHKVNVSTSAGAYVCNATYFKAMEWMRQQGRKTKVLFVHVPYLPEQTTGKPAGTPSMSFREMKAAVADLLDILERVV